MATTSSSDLKSRIIESQMGILNALAEYESVLSVIYQYYSGLFPATADCWRVLSSEEKNHADVLRSLDEVLKRGELFKNLGRFNKVTMSAMVADLTRYLEKAKKGELTEKEAISMAVSAETSIQDAHFYDIVQSDSSEFRAVAGKLASDTSRHVAAVRDLLTKSAAR